MAEDFDQHPSPSGRYLIALDVWGPRMSLEIRKPTLSDRQTGEVLLQFESSNWSLDEWQWTDDTTVRLTLRKYPGNHAPGDLAVTLDCVAKTARLGDTRIESLAQLEQRMDAALTWLYDPPAPPEPPPMGRLLGWLQRALRIR
jgi:hypothetical protein